LVKIEGTDKGIVKKEKWERRNEGRLYVGSKSLPPVADLGYF
jgi:hypothetical protein